MSKLRLFPISVVLRIMDKNGVSTCLIDGVIHDLLLKNVTFPVSVTLAAVEPERPVSNIEK